MGSDQSVMPIDSPGQEKGVIAWMARNPVAANLLMFVVMMAGLLALPNIKREIFPTFPSDSLTITVPYPGSSPEEVEEGIIVKIEEAIQDLPGIKKMTATANEGSGTVLVQFESSADFADSFNKVKVRVDGISNWPRDAEEPRLEEVLSISRVLRLSLYGPVSEHTLRELADEIRDDLLSTGKITLIESEGARDYEIAIELSETALRQYHLTFDDVSRVLRSQSQNLPGGKLRSDSQTIILRSDGQAYNKEDFEQLVLLSRADGTRVLLGDVADIRDGFVDQKVLSQFNGRPGLSLRIERVGKQDSIVISNLVREYVEKKQLALPEGIEIRIWSDTTHSLRERINVLLKSAGWGSVLVLIVLALFLRPTLAFWVVIGVPFCMLGTLFMINALDLTINVLSLFGFILVLGILVDDAIVCAESAYATLQEENLQGEGQNIESVIRGVKKVSVATIFGVLTTIIAFFPMLFLTEGVNRFFTVVSIVVMSCLFLSIIETKLILPTHLRHLSGSRSSQAKWQRAIADSLQVFAEKIYQPLLHWCLYNRYVSLAIFLCGLIFTVALVKAGLIRQITFPNIPSDYIRVELEMPKGTPAHVTHEHILYIAEKAKILNERFRQQSGEDKDVVANMRVLSETDNQARIDVALIRSTERTITSVEMGAWWREAIGEIPGAKALSFDVNAGHHSAPIDIRLISDDLETLKAVAPEVRLLLREYAGIFDVRDTFDSGTQEVDIRITNQGSALGLGQAELARQVRQAFFGEEVQRVQRGRHEVRVYLRFPENERKSLESVENMWVRLPDGREVPFNVAGKTIEKTGVSTIRRIDRQRIVNILADVDKGLVEPDRVLDDLRPRLDELVERYPDLSYFYAGEREAQEKDNSTLTTMGYIMLLMIYAALAIPLRSYGQPLLIMSVIPFGIAGAYIGHGIIGLEVSMLSTAGIIALAGIVVNDSLILIDHINQRRREGIPQREAVAMAGLRRFRAVILTSTTTFVGLLPLQLEKSIQAEFLKPMATSVSFGVLFATVVTLLLVPVLCYIAEDIRELFAPVPDTAGTGSSVEESA